MKLVGITRIRELPYAGNIEVEIGQRVNATEIVAQMNYFPGLVKKLKVARNLAISPHKLPEVVCVKQGDLVNEGDLIAFNSRWHRAQALHAPQSGIVGMVSRHLGIVYLRKMIEFSPNEYEVLNIEKLLNTTPKFAKRSISVRVGDQVSPGQIVAQIAYTKNKMRLKNVSTKLFGAVVEIKNNTIKIKNRQLSPEKVAYLAGEVIDIKPNWSVTIKAQAYQLSGVYGLGGERSGTLKVVDSNILNANHVKLSDKGKILFSKGSIEKNALYKASEIGVKALIAASCKLASLREYAGNNFIPGITGSEDVKTGVILLNNFGVNAIEDGLWNEIKKYDGCQISINGTTHIRAGAIRPEILIFPYA